MKALLVASSDHGFVGRQLRALSEEALGNYLGCMALGRCNRIFASRLSAELLHRAMAGGGMMILTAIIAVDHHLSYPRSLSTVQSIEDTFAYALRNAAKVHPEVDYATDALAEVWAHRTPPRLASNGRETSAAEILGFPRATVRDLAAQTPRVRDHHM